MNKKIQIVLIAFIISTTLVGCSNANKYSNDYDKISDISVSNIAISQAYLNSSSKSEFKKEAKKIIKDLKNTNMMTEEGKDLLKTYIEISQCMTDTILENWNELYLNPDILDKNKEFSALKSDLEQKMDKFGDKIEELKIESGFYEMLEEAKK